MPENFIDPVAIASQIIVSLQQIVSRMANPKIPSVLSFGKIAGGVRNNIIPEQVEMVGTIRNFDMGNREQIFKKYPVVRPIFESPLWDALKPQTWTQANLIYYYSC